MEAFINVDKSPSERLEAVLATHPYRLDEVRTLAIEAALRRHDGCIARTARTLGVGRTTLHCYLKRRAEIQARVARLPSAGKTPA